MHTFETLHDAVAEPVIYMIDRYVVGGFYRVHTGRGKDGNLNAPGMHFRATRLRNRLQPARLRLQQPGCPTNRFYAYGVVGRLACPAAALELEHTSTDVGSK
ncbi:MAG: glutamate--cysteine ligase [Dechloromonas sp.]|uniref:Glutamate--cysteine ligase n=1 Tax=Candidatus Dechloromonas phosphorivorans TaxID=2899244 RepID=A0A9D7LP65_9RHOO|nr:glutamate--cysteine ligase [Candidatus Dechloromonas phosphorivorans]